MDTSFVCVTVSSSFHIQDFSKINLPEFSAGGAEGALEISKLVRSSKEEIVGDREKGYQRRQHGQHEFLTSSTGGSRFYSRY